MMCVHPNVRPYPDQRNERKKGTNQITMNLSGPWGKNTAYCPTISDSSAAVALWSGTAGQTLHFSINCTGQILGYLESIQVFAV
jgi:hypothetical protein